MSSAAPGDTVLAVDGLTGPTPDAVLHDVTLRLTRASMHVVLGRIHAGKSMLMRHIAGLACAVRGRVTIDGESFDAANPPEAVLRRLRTRLGVVFEGSALLGRMTVVENVELPLLEHTDATAREARAAAMTLLGEAGVDVDDDTMPMDLSRADQRRVALARALALRPPVLLLDEPTQGLDSHAAAELDGVIAALQQANGFGLLVFSHEGRYAFGRADRISVMHHGSVVASGSRAELRESDHPIVQQIVNRRDRR